MPFVEPICRTILLSAFSRVFPLLILLFSGRAIANTFTLHSLDRELASRHLACEKQQ